MTELKNDPNFATVVHFCRLFSAILNIKPFSADLLERAILTPDSWPVFLQELIYKLADPNKDEPTERDLEGFHDLLTRRICSNWDNDDSIKVSNPLKNNKHFSDILPRERTLILHTLVEWKIHDCDVLLDYISSKVEEDDGTNDDGNMPSSFLIDSVRSSPIGIDRNGKRYYFFSYEGEDCWLFSQTPSSSETTEKDSWKAACTTLEDFQEFVREFGRRARHNACEKVLYSHLNRVILPKLQSTAAARKRADEKAFMLEMARNKRSSRLADLQRKKLGDEARHKEEEERLKREEEVAETRKREEERTLRHQRRLEEDERRRQLAAEHQLKLSGLNVHQPTREERMERRRAQGSRPESRAESAAVDHVLLSNTKVEQKNTHVMVPSSSDGVVRWKRPRHEEDLDASNQEVSQRESPENAVCSDEDGEQEQAVLIAPFVDIVPFDLEIPKRSRTQLARKKKSSRASIQRLKQAARGTLPLKPIGASETFFLLESKGISTECSMGEENIPSTSEYHSEDNSEETLNEDEDGDLDAEEDDFSVEQSNMSILKGKGDVSSSHRRRQNQTVRGADRPPTDGHTLGHTLVQRCAVPPQPNATACFPESFSMHLLPREQQEHIAIAMMQQLTAEQRVKLQQLDTLTQARLLQQFGEKHFLPAQQQSIPYATQQAFQSYQQQPSPTVIQQSRAALVAKPCREIIEGSREFRSPDQ